MAADVQVSEIDVLKAYSGKMNGLRNDSIALAVLLDRQIRKMVRYARMISTQSANTSFYFVPKVRHLRICGYKTI